MSSNFDEIGRSIPVRLLEEIAAEFRRELGIDEDVATFDVLQATWRASSLDGPTRGLQVLRRPDEYMEGSDAWVKFDPLRIEIKESKHSEAAAHQPDARFLVAHELLHARIHDGSLKHRRSDGPQRINFLRRDPLLELSHSNMSKEVQADQAARAFLMPPKFVSQARSASSLALLCAVPIREARIRFAQINDGPRLLSPDLSLEIEKRRLWEALPTIAGENSASSRLCGMYRVIWAEYGLTTQCGWFIEKGNIVAFFSRR